MTDHGWTIEIVRPGSPPTPETVNAVSGWLEDLAGGMTPAPLCVFCSAAFWFCHTPAAFLYLRANVPAPRPFSLTGICPDCATQPDAALAAAAVESLRATIKNVLFLPIAHFHPGPWPVA